MNPKVFYDESCTEDGALQNLLRYCRLSFCSGVCRIVYFLISVLILFLCCVLQ